MFSFIHTSDLHLGKRFGRMPEALRGRLTEARHASIQTLAELAKTEGAAAVLVAGDVFDAETPSPAVVRQALRAMGAAADIRWVLLPGNHDSLAADPLWSSIGAQRPDNVILALTPTPIEIAAGVVILPAPCTARRPGRDLTEWMSDAEVDPSAIRIGLAHGAVQSFGEDGASDVIAPDRAERSGLDYLALGDWHGQMRIGERTWYSGAPEPDRFKHRAPGRALVVSIGERGAPPVAAPADTGAFDWRTCDVSLQPGADAGARLTDSLPEIGRRRQTLARVVVEGRCSLAERAALIGASAAVEADFAWFELREDDLGLDYEVDDLDVIDKAGALREAAEALLADARSDALSAPEREAAKAALSRLYDYVTEAS
ncbi:DNA repair exonuclease [Pikeienuella sp. HZG-20]|uniref:metallophosphoesterase family protein n=1 Tax=Paludibacillus litoralis TaxID=3133267 RepID=UPI0030EF06B1